MAIIVGIGLVVAYYLGFVAGADIQALSQEEERKGRIK